GAGLAERRRRLARPRRLGGRQILEERPRGLRRSASIAGGDNLQEATPPPPKTHLETITRSEPPGRPRPPPLDCHPSPRPRRRGQASRLEDAGGPQPLVDSDRIRGGLHAETVS